MAPQWFLSLIRDGKAPEFDAHAAREAARLRQSFDTVEKCVSAAQEGTTEMCQAIGSFPESKLDVEVSLPFGGGMTLTMADVLDLHRWNMVYHLGQINQIQLLLGDKEMH